jgi:mannose-6-phosphate isomerase-like protein (cupin superfamily)
MILYPKDTYVHLADTGAATQLPGGDAFWSLPESDMQRCGTGWLISEFEFASDWPNWEMHPNGDEFVYLLSGDVAMLLDDGGVVSTVRMRGTGAVVVPRGVWHTAKVSAPSRMLHVTRGEGTEHRPA